MNDDRLRKQLQSLQAHIQALNDQVAAMLADRPVVDTKPLEIDGIPLTRISSVGESAHLHLAHIEKHGECFQADSVTIRRQLSGANIQATANQFGTRDSGAILYRAVPYGSSIRPSDPIKMTKTGVRVARAYRKLHGL